MTTNEYLAKVVASQTLAEDGDELTTLQERRAEVEKLLRDHFEDSSPTIRYGGSKAKGTMNKEAYDLDILCYFPHHDTGAGEPLKDIYTNGEKALPDHYLVEAKATTVRPKDPES